MHMKFARPEATASWLTVVGSHQRVFRCHKEEMHAFGFLTTFICTKSMLLTDEGA